MPAGPICFMQGDMPIGHPSLGGTGDIQTLLGESLRWVVLGPSLFVSQFSRNIGLIISVTFWTSLIVTALGSGDTRVQRWFYGLLGCFIGLTLLNLALTVSWDFIAAAIAKHLSA